jgi:sugar lactone lactonase YvrE
MEVTTVYGGICHLGEGPLWNPRRQQLFWTDIFERRIWVHDPQSGESRVFWRGGLQVGGFAFTRDDALVLCTDRGVFRLGIDSSGAPRGEPELLFRVPLAPDEMFNDITTDPVGRIFAGTLDRTRSTGTLYRFERGRPPMAVLHDVGCSNGMTFSLDERSFFHTDSAACRITRYAYDRGTGDISSPAVHYQGRREDGVPDGITIDREGCVWSAFWGASVVRRLDPEGRSARSASQPGSHRASCSAVRPSISSTSHRRPRAPPIVQPD